MSPARSIASASPRPPRGSEPPTRPELRRAGRRRLRAIDLAVRVLLAALSTATIACGGGGTATPSDEPVEYVLRFPEPQHHTMEVEATFTGLGPETLEARMSRSSPGRYAVHEFGKNVFDVRVSSGSGEPLPAERPNPHQWNVSGHDGTVRIAYRIFGDRVDGTYMAVDTTHAHLNIPATLMWARGLEGRPARVRLVPPQAAGGAADAASLDAGSGDAGDGAAASGAPGAAASGPAGAQAGGATPWRVATQLFPTDDPLVFTAPNLQYLMDSPTEFGRTVIREFEVSGPTHGTQTVRVALHHEGTQGDLERYVDDVRRIVEETMAVWGEYPEFDTGTYTFIADYLPYASGDGMEHRNSTILTSSGSLSNPFQRIGLLGTVAHEFFHAWNVERIRPASLEPFDFEEANMSSELWLAEGFTSYYGNLVLHRAGIADLDRLLATFNGWISTVATSPGRRFRSAVEMSRMAPFVDAATSIDPTYFENTFISYYTWGAAIGLGLDLELRQRSGGATTLDDYMRALWERHGEPAGPAPAIIANPYTVADARQVLAEVSGDPGFAGDFFARHVEGTQIVDYEALLLNAGLALRPRNPGHAWLGDVRLDFSSGGARVASRTEIGTPAHEAGLDAGDILLAIDGQAITSAERLRAVLDRHAPGDTVTIRFQRRDGEVDSTVELAEDPGTEIVPIEATGRAVTDAQLAFRRAWLETRR